MRTLNLLSLEKTFDLTTALYFLHLWELKLQIFMVADHTFLKFMVKNVIERATCSLLMVKTLNMHNLKSLTQATGIRVFYQAKKECIPLILDQTNRFFVTA